MDRNGVDPLSKKNSKFEIYLKRNFASDTFERVRYHESCVVLSDKPPKLDKALSYVVVGHEYIYITENPPKTTREEVHYKDVINVELKNDFPAFLAGEEAENTLHIAITYKLLQSKQRRAKKDYLKPDDIERSYSTPAHLDMLDKQSDSALSNNVPHLVVPQVGGTSPHMRQKSSGCKPVKTGGARELPKLKSSDSWDEEKFLRSFDNDNNLDVITTPRLARSANHQKDSDRLSVPNGGACCLPGLSLATSKGSGDQSSNSSNGSGDLRIAVRKGSGDDSTGYRPLPSPVSPRRSVTPSPASSADRFFSQPVTVPTKEGRKKKKKKSSSSRRSSKSLIQEDVAKGEDAQNEVFVTDNGDGPTMKETVLHLYMLCRSSPILSFIKSAWNNYKISGTMMLDPEFEQNCKAKKMPSEKLDTLFGQLKQEILNAGNNIEEAFSLIHELKVATERNFVIKKLFWKNPDLLLFMVQQLQKYLPKSLKNLNSDEGKNERADEFELVNLVLETIALMFRETETVRYRHTCLKQNKGKVASDLVVMLVCYPDIPSRSQPTMTKAAALLMMTQADQMRFIADAELANLMAEFSCQTTCVLFELILAAQQNTWGGKDSGSLSMNWLIKVLQELKNTEIFLRRLIAQAMRLISPSTKSELSPREAVVLYQQFYVLHSVMHFSPFLCSYIRFNYFEEFKYYIQAPVILSKLPKHYPITKSTLDLIEKVITKVVQKDFKFLAMQKKTSVSKQPPS